MTRITLLFFAHLKEISGANQISLELPDGATILDVKARLLEVYPQFDKVLPTAIFAIDREFAFDEDR